MTIDTLTSFMFGKPSVRRAIAVGTVLLTLAAASSCGYAAHPAVSDSAQATQAPDAAPTPDFATVSKLMNDAIAAHRLPGAVVVIGHGGKIVFHQAYGSRKLAGEPGLNGSPAPAEPMTEDTIFDMASLTKPLATATAVMQLYEQGKVQFDDPVQKYLPDFNPANDPQRAKVTLRMLLTHTSGEAADVSLKDPWGLDGADKTEGIHRALTTPLQSGPGEVFRYSDINFILLGALIEKVTGGQHAPFRRGFPSVALATQALPEPRFGWTQAQIPTSFCSRTQSIRGTIHRSRICEVKWLRRQPRPCVFTAVRHRPRLRHLPTEHLVESRSAIKIYRDPTVRNRSQGPRPHRRVYRLEGRLARTR
jgi:hypothetical protein